MKVRDLGKMPKRKVTVADILHLNGINGVLAYLQEHKHEVETMVLWVQWQDGSQGQWLTGRSSSKDLLWLIEQIKYQLLQEAMEEEQSEAK